MKAILILLCSALSQTSGPFPRPRFIPPSPPSTQQTAADSELPARDDALEREIAKIEESCKSQPVACVEEFIRLWKKREGRPIRPIQLACVYIPQDSAEALLQTIMELVVPAPDAAKPNQFARTFFGGPSSVLSKKLTSRKRLYDLALRSGCWESIVGMAGDPEEKKEYVLTGLRGCKALQCSPRGGLWSVSSAVPDSSAPDLRRLIGPLGPKDDGFWIAIHTLVDFEDEQIIPELKRMAESTSLDAEQREAARFYAVKLEYPHSPEQLLRLVQNERESKRVLMWAVGRLLWLKTSRAVIHRALAENRKLSRQGKDIAKEVDDYIRACEGPNPPPHSDTNTDLSILDRQEMEQYRAISRQEGVISAMRRFSFYSLVTSAPAGD